MPQFSIMTDEDVIRYVEATRDPLTTTALELELCARLLNALDAKAESQPLVTLLIDKNLGEADQVQDLDRLLTLAERAQALLDEHAIKNLDALEKELEVLASIREKTAEALELITTARDTLDALAPA